MTCVLVQLFPNSKYIYWKATVTMNVLSELISDKLHDKCKYYFRIQSIIISADFHRTIFVLEYVYVYLTVTGVFSFAILWPCQKNSNTFSSAILKPSFVFLTLNKVRVVVWKPSRQNAGGGDRAKGTRIITWYSVVRVYNINGCSCLVLFFMKPYTGEVVYFFSR